ncbi:hypothetical protein KC341_g3 [Hortaea werneckii]|nr:hypothetical protein KC341_g3 [Hortaea werneckii]
MSSDFSLFSLFAAGLACLVPVTNAYTQPTGSPETNRASQGNAIYTPGSTSVVPAGSPYEITWDPTTSGTVTLVLLKGPSNNAVPQYAIVEGIDNSGSYTWTPSEDLSPTDGPTGYGIELIVDATGQYQYSTQFGISNDGYDADSKAKASSSASAASTTITMSTSSTSEMTSAISATSSVSETTATANATSSTGDVYVTEVVDKFTTYCPYATSFTAGGKTYTVSSATTLTVTDCPGGCTVSKPASMSAPTTAAPVTTAMSSSKSAAVMTTGGVPANGSAPYPTGGMAVPSSLRTSASAGMPSSGANETGSGSPPIQANGASSTRLKATSSGPLRVC